MGVLMCSYCHRRYSQEAAVEELYDDSSQVGFFTPTKRRYIGAYTIKYGQKIFSFEVLVPHFFVEEVSVNIYIS